MAQPSMTRSERVAAVANRLRLILADFADESVDVRQGYLSEVVQQSLSSLAPEERQRFLNELRERFPTWDASMASVGSSKQAAVVPLTDHREWNDVSYVLERLIELAGPLKAEQKKAIAQRLAEAGLVKVGDASLPAEEVQKLCAALNLDPKTTSNPARVLEMVTRLVDFALRLDQLVWPIWKSIAPRSSLRPAGDLKSTMARFVSGQSDVPLSRNIEDLRHLLASLLTAMSQIGRRFAQRHLAKFSPSEIEANVKLEGKSVLETWQAKYWLRYIELSKHLDEPMIEREIIQIIAEYAESLPRR